MTNANLHGHYARWALSVQDLEFTIVHREGKKHQNADALSRFPRSSTADTSGARQDVSGDSRTPVAAGNCKGPPPTERDPRQVFDGGAQQARRAALVTHEALGAAESPFGVLAPARDDLLHGDLGGPSDAGTPLDEGSDPDDSFAAMVLNAKKARLCARLAASRRPWSKGDAAAATVQGPADAHGVQPNVTLDSRAVGAEFWDNVQHDGVHLIELFGGMCAGLEMLLRNGVKVHRYTYVDLGPEAAPPGMRRTDAHAVRAVAQHRIHELQRRYPRLLPDSAVEDVFALPQDVRAIDTAALVKVGVEKASALVTVAGWECQDLS